MGRVRPEPKWWRELCAGFLQSLGRRGRRPNTMRTYQYELADFGAWLHRHHVAVLTELDKRHLEAWQDELQGRSAPRTQQVAAAAVRGALRWASSQDLDLSSPTLWLCVASRRIPRLIPRPIPQADLRCVLSSFSSPSVELERLRTRALFLVILSSGARISEALSLERGQLQDRSATVVAKGGALHLLVISSMAEAAVKEYEGSRRDQAPLLFVSHSKLRPLLPMRRGEAQRSWDQLCRELGIARFRSHQIRHSCATELLRRGVNPLVIAKHLGHHGLGSIEGYAEVGLDIRRQAMRALDAGAIAS